MAIDIELTELDDYVQIWTSAVHNVGGSCSLSQLIFISFRVCSSIAFRFNDIK